MVVYAVISEIFSVEQSCDFEIWVRGQSRSLKMVPNNRPYMTSYSLAIVT